MDEDRPTDNDKKVYRPARIRSSEKIYVPARIRRQESPYVPARIRRQESPYVPARIRRQESPYVPARWGKAKEQATLAAGKSKLTEKERTRLKAILKKALANVNYVKTASGYGEKSTHLMVVNIDAREKEFKGLLNNLAEEVFREDPVVFHAFYHRLRAQILETEAIEVPFGKPHLKISPTAHPDWYLGFWKESRVGIEYEVIHSKGMPGKAGTSYFQTLPMASPVADVTIKFGRADAQYTRPEIKFQLRSGYSRHDEYISVFREYSKEPPEEKPHLGELPPDTLVHLLQKYKEKGVKEPVGVLTVYNASQWIGRCVHYDIQKDEAGNRERGTYIDPDLFDDIEIKISALASITIKNIAVELNDCKILQKTDNLPRDIVAGAHGMFKLAGSIELCRQYSVLYKNDPAELPPISFPIPYLPNRNFDYDPWSILKNPVIAAASAEVGVGWCRKFGSQWRKDGNNWDPGPGYWCGHFGTWAIDETKPNFDMPCPSACGTNRQTDHFILQDRYLYPNCGKLKIHNHRNDPILWTAKPTPYIFLGVLVKPGFYAYPRGHAGLFLYWLQTDKEDYFYMDLNKDKLNFQRVLENPPLVDENEWLPGVFRPDFDVNYFCMISGNVSNHVVARTLCAVIRLNSWDTVLVHSLAADENAALFVPWYDEGDGLTPKEDPEVITGFGDTDV